MKPKGNITFRVDANTEIGIGHLGRCLTLLRQLRNDGFSVHLIGRKQFGEKIEPLIRGVPVSWLENLEICAGQDRGLKDEVRDAEETLSIIGKYPATLSWVIVDHYGLGVQWEQCIRRAGHRILVIDDFRNRRHCADILVSDTSDPFDPSLNRNSGKTYELAGTEFALVDPQFAYLDGAPYSVKRKKRVLVSYGGSDLTEETNKALEAIRLLRNNEKYNGLLGMVDVVIGPANAKVKRLMQLAEGIKNVVVQNAPESLAPLMRKVDIFLTAGGNSMVEGLTMRKPCLITVTNNNQVKMVAQMLKKKAILTLGEHSKVGPQEIEKALIRILQDFEQISNHVKASPVFDHSGAYRISSVIQSVSKSLSLSVH